MKKIFLLALLTAVFPLRAFSAITFTQANNAHANSVAFTANNTSGCFIAVSVRWSSGWVSSITDTRGNKYKPAGGPMALPGAADVWQLWYTWNCAAGANTVTMNCAVGCANQWMAIAEYAGVITTADPLDQMGAQSGASTAGTLSSTTATPSANNELVIGYSESQNGVAFAACGGFTLRTGNIATAIEDQIQTTAAAATAQFNCGTGSGGSSWGVGIASFGPARPNTGWVQGAASNSGGGFVTSLAYPNNNTAGNFLGTFCRWFGGTLTSVTDTAGNTWAPAPSATDGSSNFLQFWYVVNAKAGANTVTCNYSGASGNAYVLLGEWSGVSTSAKLDKSATQSGSNTTGPVTPRAAGELFIAAFGDHATNGFTQCSPFYLEESNIGGMIEDAIISGTPSTSASNECLNSAQFGGIGTTPIGSLTTYGVFTVGGSRFIMGPF